MMMSVDSDASAGSTGKQKNTREVRRHGAATISIHPTKFYNGGLSERILGDFIDTERGRYVVTTTFTNAMTSALNPAVKDHPNAGGNHKKSMVQSLEGSLKRLNVDYIDVLWGSLLGI